MILRDKTSKVIHHRLPSTKRLAIADTARGLWLAPDTREPIRIATGTPRERDAAIPPTLRGTRQWPEDGGLYLLSAGLVPGVRLPEGCTLIDETEAQTAALDAVQADHDAKIDAYQRCIAARATLTDAGMDISGLPEPVKPEPKAERYLSPAGNGVTTKPAQAGQEAAKAAK